MADKYINKIKFSDKYYLLDSGANHDNNHILSGTTGDFKVDGNFFANNGVFNYIKAIDGDISNLTVDQLKAKQATVTMRLDVEGELHTNSWTASNISSIEGAFYITPTISCESGTFAYDGTSITVTAADGYSFAIDDLYMNGLEGGSSLASTWWTKYSYVLITGDVLDTTAKEWKPLGTVKGRINSNPATIRSIEINELTDSKGNSTVLTLNDIGTGNKTFRNIKISLYKRATSSTVNYPIGIYMTAMGNKGKTFLDIYGGDNQTGIDITNTIDGVTHNSGALAKPKVRIGNLLGLPPVGGINPTGWGIYTNNGFFTGTIVAQKGQIGNGATSWTIGSGSGTGSVSYIYAPTNGPTSKTAEAVGMYVGTDGINNFSTTAQYVRIYNGKIYAQGAEINGNIAATQGFTVTSSVGGQTIASMTGNGISLGPITNTSYYNMLIDTSGIKLRYNTTVLNLIDSTGMTLKNSSGSTLAEFKSYINLGTGHTNTYTGSAAMGVGLTATKTNQIVVGRYNEGNSNATFIIGDGINSSDKSNLLTVGNIAGKQITDTFVGDGSTNTFTLSNTPTETPVIIPNTYTVSSWSGQTITLNTNVTENEQIQFQYTTNEKGGYLIVGNTSGVHGKGAIVGGVFDDSSIIIASGNGASIHGIADESTMTASGTGALIHGYAFNKSTITASRFGASIHGYAIKSTMTASNDGASIHGYAFYGTMIASGNGASIHGYTDSSTMTASHSGTSIYGHADSNSTMTASNYGASIHGYAFNSTIRASSSGASIHGRASSNSTMIASNDGASIHGYAFNSIVTASGTGALIYGYAAISTMTASGSGALVYGNANSHSTMTASANSALVHGHTYESTMTASGYGASIHGYAYESTMTASGDGASIHGIANESTMTASGNGSVALNEATHALARAQLAIGSFNVDDSATTTTHPSGTKSYKTYAFIIGNGTGESARSNALTVDWKGNIMAKGMAGQIIMFAGPITQSVSNNKITTTAPTGYLLCDGSIVLVSDYPELAAILGTTYGGNGTTTFGLPDFRGRVGIGVGPNSANTVTTYGSCSASTINQSLGAKGGEASHTLQATESGVGAHSHATNVDGMDFAVIKSGVNIGNARPGSSGTTSNYFPNTTASSNPWDEVTYTNSQSKAAQSAHNNIQPYIGINYIICTGKTY